MVPKSSRACNLEKMETLADGTSFPIRTSADLLAALAHPDALRVRDHIVGRAKSLFLTGLLPDEWMEDPLVNLTDSSNSATNTIDTTFFVGDPSDGIFDGDGNKIGDFIPTVTTAGSASHRY